MPGSVQTAVPVTVLPQGLCGAFAHQREYPVLDNEYRSGESQRGVQATTSRRRWRLAKRLTPTGLGQLRDFYEARGGALEAFYFYDPYETSPKFSCDPTGMALPGRYTVRFEGVWQQDAGPGRASVSIELVQIA